MSGLTENKYDVKNLYIVKFSDEYQNYLKINNNDLNTNYLDSINYFIVERNLIKEGTSNHETYYEFYTECVLGQDFYERSSNKKITELPEIFGEIYLFPIECLTDDEKKIGSITTSSIFQIFMKINNFHKCNDEENVFVKKIKPISNY